jgi:hypothetical protein
MTLIAASAMDGYRDFANFYDAFTAGSDYETWTAHALLRYTARLAKGGDPRMTVKKTDKPVLPVLSFTKLS